MLKKLSIVFSLLFMTAVTTGCGEEIDFYDSSVPPLFDDESSAENYDNENDDLFDDYEDNVISTENSDVQAENSSDAENSSALQNNIPSDFSDALRDTLSEEDKRSYDIMYETLISGNLSVALEKQYTMDEIQKIYTCVSYDHPEIFWISLSYSVIDIENSSLINFDFISAVNSENLSEYRRRFDDECQKIISLVPQDISLYEKILFIHDYIVENTEYATDYASSSYEDSEMYYNAYGCIVQHNSVCSGYTAAFEYLMHLIGVECGKTTGFSLKNGQSHAWNYVRYDGDYYWVDVTWDDPLYESGEYSASDTENIFHSYFFITTEELERSHVITDNNIFVPECTASKYCYMRYFGNFMENYSFEEFDRMMSEKNGNPIVQFGSKEAFIDAFTDLVYNKNIYSTRYFSENDVSHFSYVSNDELYTIEIIQD